LGSSLSLHWLCIGYLLALYWRSIVSLPNAS
jgi:hypothetical protein